MDHAGISVSVHCKDCKKPQYLGQVSWDEPCFHKNSNNNHNSCVILRNCLYAGHCYRLCSAGFYLCHFYRPFFAGKENKGEKKLILAGNIIIFAGIAFMLLGIIGIFKFRNFYARILITAKIDTVGSLTFIIGVAVKHGFSFFSLKLLLLAALILFINPLVTHMIARSAYLSKNEDDFTAGSEDDT
jgi:multicomponent Na+:H+ antiporter subunit G